MNRPSMDNGVLTEVSECPQYSRKIPPEWEGLLSHVNQQIAGLDDHSLITPDTVVAVVEEVHKLGDEELEANRYYALGLAICNMAKILYRPEARQQAIEGASQIIFNNLISNNPQLPKDKAPVLRADDLRFCMLGSAFTPFAQEAVDDLPLGTHLLADTLDMVVRNRQTKLRERKSDTAPDMNTFAKVLGHCVRKIRRNSPAVDPFASHKIPGKTMDNYIRKIRSGNPSAEILAGNALTGTVITMCKVHIVKASTVAENDPEISRLDAVNPIIKLEEIDPPELASITGRYASLRIDEFPDTQTPPGETKYLEVTETGRARFRKELVKKEPEPDPIATEDAPSLHQKRLKCPAIHVAGMLALMRELVPDIVADTERRIAERAQVNTAQ